MFVARDDNLATLLLLSAMMILYFSHQAIMALILKLSEMFG